MMNPSNGSVKAVGRGRGPWRDQEVQELRRPQMTSSESSSSSTSSRDERLSLAMKSTLSINAKEFVPKSFANNASFDTRAFFPYESQKEDQQSLSEDDSDLSFNEWIFHYVTDILKSLTLNPGQFDYLSKTLLDELKPVLSEEETVKNIIALIVNQAISEMNFRYSGARLCNLFINQTQNGREFKLLLLDALSAENDQIDDNLENNTARVYGFLYFLGELYIQLEVEKGFRLTILGDALIATIKILIQAPLPENIKHSCAVLKLTGHMLDCDQPEKMSGLFTDVEKLLSDERTGVRSREMISNIMKLRSSNWGHTNSDVNPAKPSGENYTKSEWNADGIYYGPDHHALTAEQLRFLNDSCGQETVLSGDDETVWDPEANDKENEEIAAAFQEFLKQKH